MFKRPVLLLASFVFLIPSIQLLAESRIADRGPRIVVSANRTETSAKDIGGAVTVYTREEIERSQKHYVLDLLRETPGIDVVRSGGPGGNTALFMRGANSEHTLVILDGLELNNPGSTSRSYNLANLTLDNIERIEVIRGPQSSLYGSDAIGGVIVLTTRQGGDGLHGSTSFEGGSFSTFHETASVNGAIDEGSFSFEVSREDSDGISAAEGDGANQNLEDDEYDNTTFSSRVVLTPIDELDIDLSFRNTSSDASIDREGGAAGDDPNRFLDTRETFFSARASGHLFSDRYEPSVGFGINDQRFTDNNDRDPMSEEFLRSRFEGRLVKWDSQHRITVSDSVRILAGLETEEERAHSLYFSDGLFGPYEDNFSERTIRNNGYFVDVLTTPLESFSTSFGIRLDDHESFDSEVTFRVAPVVKLEDSGTRIRGSVASGFKAPSLSQLYSSFGNPELEPEESIGWEIGIDQEFAEGLVRFGATFFRNDIDQLISFNSETFRSENIAEAEITGFELSLEAEPVEHLLLKADYTFTDAEDKNLGTQLLRRPENKFAFSGFYSFLEDRGQVGVRANVVGHRSDTDFSTFPSQSVRLGGYTVVDLLGSYRITETLEFFARVENLFDQEYQDVFGFGTPGVAGYGGLRVRFS